LYDQQDPECNSTGVADPGVPGGGRTVLLRSYPNPSAGSISIEYEVSGSAPVDLRVFDVEGRLVRHLGSSSSLSGVQRLAWDGRDAAGREMPSGTYLCELRSGDARSTVALRLLR
ncbi:MAG: FlgD immunoglobulin-like domain containing protein, partial [Candidatus Eisenbacteria bacterium]|nr:FlgD immunoglobulin-like domain containing protein [Candidatus Eisenbacteria bacterium]